MNYPTTVGLMFLEQFENLDTETLFFIFYYQQGTCEQIMASKILKKRKWIYNKKYCTWFKKKDPNLNIKEGEPSVYLYFDYESGWCQRMKSDFVLDPTQIEKD